MNNAKRVHNHDGMVKRNRAGRLAFFTASVLVIVGLPTLIGAAFGNALGFFWTRFIFGLVGFGLGLRTMLRIFPRYWLIVPQTQGYVTTNQFPLAGDNANVPYGPSGHLTYPWELREEAGNIPLDTLTVTFDNVGVPTTTSEVFVDGSVLFRISLPHITRFVELDESAITHGFADQIVEFLSEELTGKSAEEARHEIKELRKKVTEHFQKKEIAEEVLEKFALIVEGTQIANIRLPEEVQKARNAIEEVAAIGKNLWKYLGFKSRAAFEKARADGTISEDAIKRAREEFLASTNNNATLDIKRIDMTGAENSGGAGAIAAGLIAAQKK